mgnify:CR=1 FL=1
MKIKKIMPLASSILMLAMPAHASVIQNMQTRQKTYTNDGDGMSYIITESNKRVTVLYDEVLRFPLDSQGRLRYTTSSDKNSVTSINAKPGPPGIKSSRPLTDLEVAKIRSG